MATAPAPDPKPAPGPEIQLGGPSRITTLGGDAIARLNSVAAAIAGGTPPPEEAEPAPEQPKPAPAAPAAKAPPSTPAPAPAKAADAKEPAATPPAKSGKEGPAQLREAFERAQTKLAEAQARVAELEAAHGSTAKEKADAYTKLADLETRAKGYEERIAKELEPLRAQYTEQSKRLQEREEALRMRDYTATTEWHERYVKPLTEKHAEAVQYVSELEVTQADGKTTPATQEHLNHVLGARSANEAAQRAAQLFGDNPALIGPLVNYRTQLRALQQKQQDALKNAQLESAEWQKRTQATQVEQAAAFKSKVAANLAKYLPQPPDTDPEAKAAFEQGKRASDLLTNGDSRLSQDEVAETVAKLHAAIIDHPVQLVVNKKLAAENAALKEELAKYRVSEPPVETRRTSSAPVTSEKGDWKGNLLAKATAAALSGR